MNGASSTSCALGCALLCLLPAMGSAQDRTVESLLRAARWRFEADFRADKAALDRLLADDLTHGRTSGVRHSKSEVLALVGAGGPYALDYSTPDSLHARVFGETGVVTRAAQGQAHGATGAVHAAVHRHLGAAERALGTRGLPGDATAVTPPATRR